ncbi:HAD family hydrolase [Natronorubrum daqingense]|uniref:Haloacid dehalogenase n=1 Tax=Natronorubrum daqingense TaxID=588898 RepID=A0A1N7C6L0_9EURY|nr:HAD family hydrolase [Natronorubrum daqingense]APX96761.1 haloacid dehalogenase [Natronorubrum daqingense]SIR59143.1 putative hydrolase of the HAD superfamily [Natronorubrum daqingense]
MSGDGFADGDSSGASSTDATDTTAWDAVFWDIGGVILDLESVQGAHAAFVAELVDEHDLEMAVEDAVDAWRTAVGNQFREREGTEFQSAREAYATGVEALVDEDLPRERWEPVFERHVESSIEPVPGAVETIHELARRDVHVGVLSDVDDDAGKQMLERFGVRESFDSITTSEEVGRTKPDPAMFETALEKAGAVPKRSLMIGDRYDHDVKGADEVGINGVAFGAEDGPAVSYRIDDLTAVLEIVEDTEPGV